MSRAGILCLCLIATQLRLSATELQRRIPVACEKSLSEINATENLVFSPDSEILRKQLIFLFFEHHDLLAGEIYSHVGEVVLNEAHYYEPESLQNLQKRLSQVRAGGPPLKISEHLATKIWDKLLDFYGHKLRLAELEIKWSGLSSIHRASCPFDEYKKIHDLLTKIENSDANVRGRSIQLIRDTFPDFLPVLTWHERLVQWRSGLATNQTLDLRGQAPIGWIIASSVLKTIFSGGVWVPLKFGARVIYQVRHSRNDARYRRTLGMILTENERTAIADTQVLSLPVAKPARTRPIVTAEDSAVGSVNQIGNALTEISNRFYEISLAAAKTGISDEFDRRLDSVVSGLATFEDSKKLADEIRNRSGQIANSIAELEALRSDALEVNTQLGQLLDGLKTPPANPTDLVAYHSNAQATGMLANAFPRLAATIDFSLKGRRIEFERLQKMTATLSLSMLDRALGAKSN